MHILYSINIGRNPRSNTSPSTIGGQTVHKVSALIAFCFTSVNRNNNIFLFCFKAEKSEC